MTEQQNTLPDTDALDFETALQALNDLVKRMESGELSLEDTLKEFEQGVHLTHACQTFLKQAEQRVHLLDREGVEHPLAVDHEQ